MEGELKCIACMRACACVMLYTTSTLTSHMLMSFSSTKLADNDVLENRPTYSCMAISKIGLASEPPYAADPFVREVGHIAVHC